MGTQCAPLQPGGGRFVLRARPAWVRSACSVTRGVHGGRCGGIVYSAEASGGHALSVGRTASRYAQGDRDGVSVCQRPVLAFGPTRFPGRPHRQWLDFQHDVTVADASAAVEQGFAKVEHFKRFTTTGMAVDQGKTSLRNSLEQLALLGGVPLTQLKPPTYRPPYSPLSLAMAAGPITGRWYRPERHLPCHAEHRRFARELR